MKAVQFSEYGDPDVLHVLDVEEPHAATGQVRVAVNGASVNPIDWKIRSGAVRATTSSCARSGLSPRPTAIAS